MRGQSLGKRMVEEAIRIVSKDGKSKLMLTSKPSRIVANKLYQSVGFQKKETNVYKMDFDK
ncbi:GNAT family N-acetyltransferase [uncultured Bacteroides sp.]